MAWKSVLKRAAKITLGIAGVSVAVILAEVFIAMRDPTAPYTPPSRLPMQFGHDGGAPLTYVVMGDSTAAGQGAEYKCGIAVNTSHFLAQGRKISMINLGVSGAVTADVLCFQLPQALKLHPDIVLVCVGSNDVTHFTHLSDLRLSIASILKSLASASKPPVVVVTGSADLGSVPRFLQPLKSIATVRSVECNRVFEQEASRNNAIWCDLGAKTGPAFRQDPSLFGADRFHPNERGYAEWVAAIDPGLAEALVRIDSK